MAEFYCSPQIFSGFIVLILVWIFLSVFSSVSLSQEFSPPPSLCHFLHTQTLWGRLLVADGKESVEVWMELQGILSLQHLAS